MASEDFMASFVARLSRVSNGWISAQRPCQTSQRNLGTCLQTQRSVSGNRRLRCHLLDVTQAHADMKPVELRDWGPLCTIPYDARQSVGSVSKHGQFRMIG